MDCGSCSLELSIKIGVGARTSYKQSLKCATIKVEKSQSFIEISRQEKLQGHFLLLLMSMNICSSIFRMISYTSIIYLDSSMNEGYKKIACTHNLCSNV